MKVNSRKLRPIKALVMVTLFASLFLVLASYQIGEAESGKNYINDPEDLTLTILNFNLETNKEGIDNQGYRMEAWSNGLGNKYKGGDFDIFGMNELNCEKRETGINQELYYLAKKIECPGSDEKIYPFDCLLGHLSKPYFAPDLSVGELNPQKLDSVPFKIPPSNQPREKKDPSNFNDRELAKPLIDGDFFRELGVIFNQKKVERVGDWQKYKLPRGGIGPLSGWSSERYLLGARFKFKGTNYHFNFYSTHLSTEKCWRCRTRQSEEIMKLVQANYKPGDLPPVVVGDFNTKGDEGREVEAKMRRDYLDLGLYFGFEIINKIWVGKPEAFSGATSSWEPVSFTEDPKTKEMTALSNGTQSEISDHRSQIGVIKISNEIIQKPSLVWWDEKDFKGKRYVKTLYKNQHYDCLKLKANNEMKSLKFFAYPGWRLRLFDDEKCSTSDDWGEVVFPNEPMLSAVSVPKIGKRGENEVHPSGHYFPHILNDGLPGNVSSIQHFSLGEINQSPSTAAFKAELAYRYAPIHYQDTDDTDHRADYITRFDYDGNWVGIDNWENLHSYGIDLSAVVYYSVVETESHWFVIYSFFHPRDWTDNNTDQEHENDLEGLLAVVRKGSSTYGDLQGIITVYHRDFYTYTPQGSSLTNGNEDIDGNLYFQMWDGANHPKTAQQAKGHGVKSWPHTGDFDGSAEQDGIIYYPSKTGNETPSSGNDRSVKYKLVSIEEGPSLWTKQLVEANMERAQSSTFGSWGEIKGDEGGGCGDGLPTCISDAANTPWGWDDWDDGPTYKGEMALDPAKLVDHYFDGLGFFSHFYLSNFYVEGLLEKGFNNNFLPRGWPNQVSIEELFAKMSVIK